MTRNAQHLEINPTNPEVEKKLTINTREFVQEGYKKTIKYRKTELFTRTNYGSIITYQGFWADIDQVLRKSPKDYKVRSVDRRTDLPIPDYAGMRGLRGTQPGLLLTAVTRRTSGLIGAPTRYGKTYLMLATARMFAKYNILVIAPGEDLLDQLFTDFSDAFKDRPVVKVGGGSRTRSYPNWGITVASMDSLHKLDKGLYDVILIDEPHAVVTESRMSELDSFTKGLRYGFGATLEGRFDNKDYAIVGLIGPILSNTTYTEAVRDNMIAPLKVAFYKVGFRQESVEGARNSARKQLLLQSGRLRKLIKSINGIIPKHWQTLFFIENEDQADFFEEVFDEDIFIAMAKKLKKKERKELTSKFKSGRIKRSLASKIYIQGVTFPYLRILVNLASGGPNTGAIQKPGRLLQKEDWKNYGLLIDVLFVCENPQDDTRKNPGYEALVGECYSRMKLYKKIGYDVEVVDNGERLMELIMESGGEMEVDHD